ncbi:MAG UNVERIFIED_CONTAM: ATP-binding cassette domain-containing protein [Planctomycetaceae bacterium]
MIGQSGSGKSTLLHVMGLLDSPDAGEVLLDGNRIDNLAPAARDQLRNHVFGFIFQFYHLLPELSLLENVMAPLMIRHSLLGFWKNRREIREAASADHRAGGFEPSTAASPFGIVGRRNAARRRSLEQLVARPEILLADEPTGNLDAETGAGIMELLQRLNRDQKLTIIMVTHDESIAAQAHRTVRLKEGRIQGVAWEDAA